jgi:type 1 glutamine amidotransferase
MRSCRRDAVEGGKLVGVQRFARRGSLTPMFMRFVMKKLSLVFGLLLVLLWTPMTAQREPLRIFIRAGEKTHGPAGNDQHDYPLFLEEWTQLLTERGASVQGALRFPTAGELAKTDVMIIHKGDGGTCSVPERALLNTYTQRGGGLVILHDGMCSDDAAWFSTVAGAAKQHGEANWSRGMLKLQFVDKAHPITKGLPDFEFNDEAFYRLTKAPEMHALVTTAIPENGEVVPQAWVYEKTSGGSKSHRSFVSMQAHYHKNFSQPTYQELILRGIAWAGKRDVTLLLPQKSTTR